MSRRVGWTMIALATAALALTLASAAQCKPRTVEQRSAAEVRWSVGEMDVGARVERVLCDGTDCWARWHVRQRAGYRSRNWVTVQRCRTWFHVAFNVSDADAGIDGADLPDGVETTPGGWTVVDSDAPTCWQVARRG